MRKGFLLGKEPQTKRSRKEPPVQSQRFLTSFEKIADLPNELILTICWFLPRKDLLAFSLVSTRFHEIANSNLLWGSFAKDLWKGRDLKKDVANYDGNYKALLKDRNRANVFYFTNKLCPEAKLAKHDTEASINGHDSDCILLAQRGMTKGCYTFRVRIDGKGQTKFPLLLVGLPSFTRATIGITKDTITAEGWRNEYLIAYYLADMILHNNIEHSQVEARSNLDEKGINYGDTVAAVVNLIDAENNTIRFYHNDKPVGDEGFVRFRREDESTPVFFFFRLGDGETQRAQVLHGTDLAP